jgi:TonB family protein
VSASGVLGESLHLERRGAPALAGGISLALHAALLLVAFAGWSRRGEPPALAAAESEVFLSIARPAPPRPEPDTERADESVRAEPPRPLAHAETVERVEQIRHDDAPPPADAPLAPARITRAAPPERPAAVRSGAGTIPRAARSSAGGVRAPALLGDARPHYPSACRGERHRPGGCEGAGRYAIEVDAGGRVLSAKAAESAGCRGLNEAALRFLLRRARFRPAAVDGVPVPWEGRIVIRFDITERGAGRE